MTFSFRGFLTEDRARFLFISALFVLLGFIVYAPALRGSFIWDDTLLVQRNPLGRGDLNWRTVWFQTDFPLSIVVLRLEYLLWGSKPFGYHFVNVALHICSALLLWRV